VNELDILSSAERSELLTAGAGAVTQVTDSDVAGLFTAAARSPDTVAVVHGDSALTYRELAERSRQLAQFLHRRGVGPDVLVGLCVEPGMEMIIGVLGVLAAGGAYVPLDPGYPGERIAFMLRDCDPALVLTVARLRDRLPAGDWAVVSLDETGKGTAQGHDDVLPHTPHPSSLAYVIYTSGSTGTPKGVAVTHRNVVNLVSDRYWGNGNHQRTLLHSPFSFDASTYELWVPLLSGGRVVIAPENRGDISELNDTLARHGVTVAYFTTALLEVMAHEAVSVLRQLREVWAGGDVLSPVALQRVLDECPDTTVVHEYGPTETTVFCSFQRFGEGQRQVGVQTLGDPMDNVRMYLLDDRLRLTPPGAIGDLYLGGEGVAREYLKRRVLSATRFVADPFCGRGARMYRTGDLARWGSTGQLEFAGRADNQVKVRGFRVEPGEVETVVASHPAVGQVAVAAQEDPAGDKCLVAYVVPTGASELDVRALRDFAREHLPEHLVPSLFMIVHRLPLTPSGKLDRRALPPLPGTHEDHGQAHAAPRTRAEERVAQVWRESLGVSKVGIYDSFFDLGGDSHLALQVMSRLQTLFRVEIPIRAIFQFPTIADLTVQMNAFVGSAGSLAHRNRVITAPRALPATQA
jgi:amino acid adenylation domain-containing protein